MNIHVSLFAMAVAAVLLTGCVTPSNRAASTAATQSAPYGVKGSYVALVNQEARRRGVQVQWVNPPITRHRGTHTTRQPLQRNDAASRADLY